MPGEPVEWSLSETDLDKRLKKEREEGKRAEPMCCGKCGFMFAGAPVCPECGAPVPRRVKKEDPKLANERLVQVAGESAAAADRLQREWQRVVYMARAKGWPCGRANAVFKAKFGEWPDRLGLTPAFGFQMKDVPVADALDVVRVGGVA